MARRRDYAAEYARRQQRARELGFAGYYARRVRGGKPPAAPPPSGDLLARLRGHAGPKDLEALLRSGRAAVLLQTPLERDQAGRVQAVEVIVQTTDGRQRTFRLRGRQLEPRALRPLHRALVDSGSDIYSEYPLGLTEPRVDLVERRRAA